MEGTSQSAETWNRIAKTLCEFIFDVLYKVLGPHGFSDVIWQSNEEKLIVLGESAVPALEAGRNVGRIKRR